MTNTRGLSTGSHALGKNDAEFVEPGYIARDVNGVGQLRWDRLLQLLVIFDERARLLQEQPCIWLTHPGHAHEIAPQNPF